MNSSQDSLMAEALENGKMEIFMRASMSMVSSRDKDFLLVQCKAGSIRENGSKVK